MIKFLIFNTVCNSAYYFYQVTEFIFVKVLCLFEKNLQLFAYVEQENNIVNLSKILKLD
jgi:hypothetical protein